MSEWTFPPAVSTDSCPTIFSMGDFLSFYEHFGLELFDQPQRCWIIEDDDFVHRPQC